MALGLPSGRASPCRVRMPDAYDARDRGYARRFELTDSAAALPLWTRDLTLDVDSAGRPRRLRALAVLPGMPGTPGEFNPLGPVVHVDVVVAFLASDGRVKGGVVGRLGADRPAPHGHYTGDPLPASLHAPSIRLAQAVRGRCAR